VTEILLEAGKIFGVIGAGCALIIFGVNWARGKKDGASAEELNGLGKRVGEHEKRITALEHGFETAQYRFERLENKIDKVENKVERMSDVVSSIDKRMERICAIMEVGVKQGVFSDRRAE